MQFKRQLTFILLFLPFLSHGNPSCEIESHQWHNKMGTVSGVASGFQLGKIYVTLTNGERKYTTVAEKNGHWALSFPDLEPASEITCWQEGTPFHAKLSLKHPENKNF